MAKCCAGGRCAAWPAAARLREEWREMEAVLVSAALPGRVLAPGARGRVHSVFARACNLEVGGCLVTLAAPELGPGPHAVLLPLPAGGFPALGVAPGQPAVVAGGALVAGPLRVLWQGAPRWDPAPAPPPSPGSAAGLGANGKALAAALADGGRDQGMVPAALAIWAAGAAPGGAAAPGEAGVAPGGAAAAMAERARRGAVALARAAAAGDAAGAAAAAGALVGLGPGFTPAGDDFLGGVIAGLALAQRWRAPAPGGPGPAVRAVAGALAAWAAAVPPRATGLVSRALLAAAAAGHLPAAAGATVRWLLGPAAPPPEDLRALLQIGHSSGADTAGGFLFALRLLVPEPTT